MNSIVGPSFKIIFVEKSTCRSPKQCIDQLKKILIGKRAKHASQTHTNIQNSHRNVHI